MTWLSIQWLWGLLPVWLLVWLADRYQRQHSSWQRWLEPHLLQAMLGQAGSQSQTTRWHWLVGFALTVFIISLAGPSWQHREQPLLVSTSARVLVVDLSYSMLATDVAPNRIAWTKQFLRNQLSDDFEGETALIVFSGQAFVVSPLTRDNNTLRRFINALQPERMPSDGSRLDLALRDARELLSNSPSGRGRITIISDGVDSSAATKEVASLAYEAGSELVFVAVGTPEGSPLPASDGGLLRDENDQIVIAAAAPETLREIAETVGGQFVEHSDPRTLLSASHLVLQQTAINNLDNTGATSIPENGGYWLLWLALPCLLVLFRKNVLPVMLIGVLFFHAEEASASGWSDWWQNDDQRAWQALNAGQPEYAAELADDPFIKAHALYQLGEYRALLLLPDLTDSAEGIYLRANAMVQLGLLKQSLESYQQALSLRPEFPTARYNLALVQFYLDQQSTDSDAEGTAIDSQDLDTENAGQSETRDSQALPGMDNDQGQDNQGGLGAGTGNALGERPDNEIDAAVIDAELQQIIADLQRESGGAQEDLLSSWSESLNTDLGELLQRKFLRDYQRATGDR